jgi:hypothetical protein
MPKKFSEFFTLNRDKADDFQERLYEVIKDATTIVDCYCRMYRYIIGGLKWSSRQDRHDLMHKKINMDGLDQQQMEDSRNYFEDSELVERKNRVLFEYLVLKEEEDTEEYGYNVFILKVDDDDDKKLQAQKAFRQIELWSRVKIYNDRYKIEQEKHDSLPNKEIEIDLDQGYNPDDDKQIKQLKKFVGDLVTWVKNNYPDLKALLAAKGSSGLFDLVFPEVPEKGQLSDQQTVDALDTMLNYIGYIKLMRQKDSHPLSTRKAFGEWLIDQLKETKEKEDFWNNQIISPAYKGIVDLTDPFISSPGKNRKIFGFFKTLFADFLSPNLKPKETVKEAECRRSKALKYIKNIFVEFKSDNLKIKEKYEGLIVKALKQIQTTCEKGYTSDLLLATATFTPDNKVPMVLPVNLANELKATADELLETLPLRLKNNTEVRFFTVDNFLDLGELNSNFYESNKNRTDSYVTFKFDPQENGQPEDRPIYRSLKTSEGSGIAFCNLPDLHNGTFYYVHTSPAIVEVEDRNKPKRIRTIDFHNYTITYKKKNGKPKNPTHNDSGEPYRDGGKTVRFFEDLMANTKWTKIGVRRYDPYYSTNPADASKPAPHLKAYVAAGRGLQRVLPLGDKTLCVWMWNSNNSRQEYGKLGEAVGLPADREIIFAENGDSKQPDNGQHCLIGDTQYTFVKFDPIQFRSPDGFYYQFISIKMDGENEETLFFVRVNTPSPGVSAVLTKTEKGRSRTLTKEPKDMLELFDFSYYRRIISIKDADDESDASVTESWKVIQLFSKGDTKKPSGATALKKFSNKDYDAVGVNLPICFNFKENIIQYYRDKQRRGKIINKGETLYREQKTRKDAATEMNPIIKYIKKPLSSTLSASKVPATEFAKGAMRQSPAVRVDWGVLKLDSRNSLPVNQEWCHLRGHGDGGQEYPGNFVSGSFHCNTEQLAIETGQRLVTQQKPKDSYLLHTTAYLLRDAEYQSTDDDKRKSEILAANYLDDEVAYENMLEYKTVARQTKKKEPSNDDDMQIGSPSLRQGDVAPLAAYIRYKVMQCESTVKGSVGGQQAPEERTISKYFDFIFEGQSEFIDNNQFKIISRAVQFALAGETAFKTWYEQEITESGSKDD